ncbi:MAG TPA: hypothetical protein VJH95_04085 [Candidatus Nanoarchaeia archaeon]|nr:hypothetical protein [Candidatus Nanoarchaeia archaeon]
MVKGRNPRVTINEIDSHLKQLGGVDKRIEYLENVLKKKNSLSPETLIHVYETVSELYYQKPSPGQDKTYPTSSDKAYVYGIDANLVRKDVKYYKEFDEHKKEWVQKYEETIKQIHEYNPKYVFLTETSSIPSGYLIKEALRKAYQNSPLPKFYRVDPRQVREVMFKGDGKKKRKLEEFFRKRIKNKEANILVYDTDWDGGKSPGSIVALLKHPERFGFDKDIQCTSVKMNGRIFPKHARKLEPEVKEKYGIDDSDIAPIIGIENPFLFSRLTEKDTSYPQKPQKIHDFRGKIRRRENYPSGNARHYNSRYRTPLELIAGAKKLGRELGQEIHSELEQEAKKKKSLEQRISIMLCMGGFLGSLIFFQSKITGNAIADLSMNTNSWVGGTLLVVGLIGGLFWVKSRKEKSFKKK